jgi:hypothetical protein
MVANKKRKEITAELIEDARKFRFCGPSVLRVSSQPRLGLQPVAPIYQLFQSKLLPRRTA